MDIKFNSSEAAPPGGGPSFKREGGERLFRVINKKMRDFVGLEKGSTKNLLTACKAWGSRQRLSLGRRGREFFPPSVKGKSAGGKGENSSP